MPRIQCPHVEGAEVARLAKDAKGNPKFPGDINILLGEQLLKMVICDGCKSEILNALNAE